jgi:hypothetical protein
MAAMEPKDSPKNESFFRKVVRFVAHPTTDWTDLNTLQRNDSEADLAKIELKAMIERKRRNDFVRKREFDMLRKIRREGLTGERLAGLEGLSRLDDSEVRSQDSAMSRVDYGVKAKIDAIEQQMVGEANTPGHPIGTSNTGGLRRGAAVMRSTTPAAPGESFFNATTSPQVMRAATMPAEMFRPTSPLGLHDQSMAPTEVTPFDGGHRDPSSGRGGEGLAFDNTEQNYTGSGSGTLGGAPLRGNTGAGTLRISALSPLYNAADSQSLEVEVTELAHDPELDEAVISFANADFDQCERMLQGLVANGGARAQHADTWYALFDLYRATGQQAKFESLAMDYVQRLGWSPPQWFSLPKQVAEAAAAGEKKRGGAAPRPGRSDATIGWIAPSSIDVDTVAGLRSQLLQMPLPWVLDWRAARAIDPEACTSLTHLLRDWGDEPIEMRWIGGEDFFTLLADLSPIGMKDADPAIWMLRLEALRLANRPVDFDQTAIDYCLTYEVSPPSWAPSRCALRMSGGSGVTVAPITHIADVSTGFIESQPDEDPHRVATVDLSGQLTGDIAGMLKSLDAQIGPASNIAVSCARLIRIDFIAAGDLLNWVFTKHGEGRSIKFVDAHRLVALFCGAMGISEHARVTVRNH